MPDGRRAPSGYDATPESYLHTLEANGMSHGVLVQPSFLGADNSYLVASLLRYPDRFRGIAVVDPEISGDQLDRLQAAGVVGIRLNLIGLPGPDLDSAAWTSLLEQVRQRDWQVEVHRLAGELRPVLEPLLTANVKVVVDHFGRPDEGLGVDNPGFRYLLSVGVSETCLGEIVRQLPQRTWRSRRGNGSCRDAFAARGLRAGSTGLGSDWPHTLFEATVSYGSQRLLLEHCLPDAADRRVVLLDSPARLFSFTAAVQ